MCRVEKQLKLDSYKQTLEDTKWCQEKKTKGIPKQIVKKELNFDSYKRTLEDTECKKQYVQFNCIRSMNHQIYSLTCNKAGLSNYDNKRYYLSNNESLPYGHQALPGLLNNLNQSTEVHDDYNV